MCILKHTKSKVGTQLQKLYFKSRIIQIIDYSIAVRASTSSASFPTQLSQWNNSEPLICNNVRDDNQSSKSKVVVSESILPQMTEIKLLVHVILPKTHATTIKTLI